MKKSIGETIGWINGKWGNIYELSIPICDRGLKFSDGIFETILILNGKPQLLNRHYKRWEKSADMMGMKRPPQLSWLEALIKETIDKASLTNKNGSLRLNWSRGNAINRGIEIEENHECEYRFWLIVNPGEPIFTPISTIISTTEKRNPYSKISVCKTFNYGQSIQSRREAKRKGFDEALLQSTNDEISCGSTANLIIKRNQEFLTPHLQSGCLPGIMRGVGIENGLIKETHLTCVPKEGDQWFLINSLSCRPIKLINNVNLQIYTNVKSFWTSLLSE